QVNRLKHKLRDEGIPHYMTMEPTDSPIGGVIRQIMTGRVKADNRVIALLFAADRLDHLLNDVNGIAEKVENGTTVVSDRYYLSSYAYHGVDLPMEWVVEANAPSAQTLKPTIHIFIDTSIETVMDRIRRRGTQRELFEKEARLAAVREKYFEAIELLKGKENIIIIDGNRSPEEIFDEVWETVRPLWGNG
ncbi:MAG: dTMP kinase, partial [Lachnospiraceae bacterium]|nr:dTMP kinase [Lachnospiraceae bacterium]